MLDSRIISEAGLYRFLLLQNRHTTAMDGGSANNAGAIICPYILYISPACLWRGQSHTFGSHHTEAGNQSNILFKI